jgi:predicted nuclease of predicted toxin-antitoxin system
MKILVDENIPRMTVGSLRELGHDVKDIRGTAEQGLSDCDLWTLALTESRLFVTTDKGFTEYRADPHPGILIVRLRQPNRSKIHSAVMLAIGRFRELEWPGLLVVVRDATMSTSRAGGPVEK